MYLRINIDICELDCEAGTVLFVLVSYALLPRGSRHTKRVGSFRFLADIQSGSGLKFLHAQFFSSLPFLRIYSRLA